MTGLDTHVQVLNEAVVGFGSRLSEVTTGVNNANGQLHEVGLSVGALIDILISKGILTDKEFSDHIVTYKKKVQERLQTLSSPPPQSTQPETPDQKGQPKDQGAN